MSAEETWELHRRSTVSSLEFSAHSAVKMKDERINFYSFAFFAPFAVNSPVGSIKTLDLNHYAQEVQRNARAGARPAHLREAGTRCQRRVCLCACGTGRGRAHS